MQGITMPDSTVSNQKVCLTKDSVLCMDDWFLGRRLRVRRCEYEVEWVDTRRVHRCSYGLDWIGGGEWGWFWTDQM